MDNRKYLPFVIIGVIAFIVILSAANRIFYKVEATERAVIFRTLSGELDKDNIVQPGWSIIAPWNEIYRYDVSEQNIDEKMIVLVKNGLRITVDVTVRFHPEYDKIGTIHENFKGDHVNKLIKPEIRAAVRRVMGKYTADEIYSTKRADVELAIATDATNKLSSEGNEIKLKALLIRSIELPEQMKMAIENKLKQEQEALAYQFRLDKETSEAERKRIAAEGEAKANKIINSSLTPELLKMRGIEATQQLANSPNAKVIVIGSGDGGLPLILNGN